MNSIQEPVSGIWNEGDRGCACIVERTKLEFTYVKIDPVVLIVTVRSLL